MRYVIVVSLSPDPEDNFAIGPYATSKEAWEYVNDWADTGDSDAGYASVWPLNPPAEES